MKHFTLSITGCALFAMMALSTLPSSVQAKASPRMMEEEISQDSLIKLKKDTLSTLVTKANALISTGISASLTVTLSDDVSIYEDYVNDEGVALEDLNTAIAKMREDLAAVDEAATAYNKFSAAVSELSELETKYPDLVAKGGAALEKEYERLEAILSGESSTLADYQKGYTDAKAAKIAYLLSGGYSAENPADLTCLINYPNMRTSSTEPSDSVGFGSWGAHEGIYKADTLQGGWKYAIATSAKYVANRYMRGMTCMQLWAGAVNTIDINQKITDLPNGLYTVSAMFNTTTGRENDQHAYGTSGDATSVSPSLTADGLWPVDGSDDDIVENDWTTLTTDKVLVSDGTLTIGAASNVISDDGVGDKGWFCITGFKLKYYGSDDSQIVKDLAAKQESATAMADTMKLKADKNALLTAIANSKETGITTNAALAIINAGISQATISNSKYNTFVGTTVPSYYAQLDTTVADTKAMLKTVMTYINEALVSDTANYKMFAGMEAMLANYTTQIALINTSKTAYTQYASSKYYTQLMTELDNEVAAMKASALSATTLEGYAKLIGEYAMAMQLESVMSTPGENNEVTFLITNPTTYGTNNSFAPEGWTIDKGVGNVYFDWKKLNADEQSHPVFLTWNGAAGTVLWNANQTINNVPNGTYRLEALFGATDSYDASTLGTGVCLTASTTASGALVKEHTVKYERDFYQEFFPSLYVESDETIANGEAFGSVWAKSLKAYNSGNFTHADSANIFGGTVIDAGTENPNDISKGYGWYTETIDNIVVNDHKITIGCSTDSTVTGHKFLGCWFEITNFKLYYTAAGDNADYVVVGMDEAKEEQPISVYSDNGRIIVKGTEKYNVYDAYGQLEDKDATQAPGMYIVRSGSQSKKIMVK